MKTDINRLCWIDDNNNSINFQNKQLLFKIFEHLELNARKLNIIPFDASDRKNTLTLKDILETRP